MEHAQSPRDLPKDKTCSGVTCSGGKYFGFCSSGRHWFQLFVGQDKIITHLVKSQREMLELIERIYETYRHKKEELPVVDSPDVDLHVIKRRLGFPFKEMEEGKTEESWEMQPLCEKYKKDNPGDSDDSSLRKKRKNCFDLTRFSKR